MENTNSMNGKHIFTDKERQRINQLFTNIKINLAQGSYQIAENGVDALEKTLKNKGLLDKKPKTDDDDPTQWDDGRLAEEIRDMIGNYGDEYNDPLIEALARIIERNPLRKQKEDITPLKKNLSNWQRKSLEIAIQFIVEEAAPQDLTKFINSGVLDTN